MQLLQQPVTDESAARCVVSEDDRAAFNVAGSPTSPTETLIS